MKIGRYVAQRPLGAGSFATVWLVFDELLETEAAAKVLADNWARNADVRRRFIDEARFLRRIDHDRVVRVHEVDLLPDGRPYFVMNWADRGSLEGKLRRNVFDDDPVAAVRTAIEMCECLRVVHDEGLVHRDVKPSNVLYRSARASARRSGATVDGEPLPDLMMLGDFGLAKDVTVGSGLTMAAGTPQYMAPEQAMPAGTVDARADVFSTVAVLFEMLSGRPAFPESGMSGARTGRADQRTELPSELVAQLPGSLQAVFDRGLAYEAEARYAGVRELSAALDGVLAELTDPARPRSRRASRLDDETAFRTAVSALVDRAGALALDAPAAALVRRAGERLSVPLSILVVGAGEAGSSHVAWELAGAALSPVSSGGHGLVLMKLAEGASELATVHLATGVRHRQPLVEDNRGELAFDLGADPFTVTRVDVTLARPELRQALVWDAPDEGLAGELLPSADLVVLAFPAGDDRPGERATRIAAALRGRSGAPLAVIGVVPVTGASMLGDPAATAGELGSVAAVTALCCGAGPGTTAYLRDVRAVMAAVGARATDVAASAALALLEEALGGAAPGDRDVSSLRHELTQLQAGRPGCAELAFLRRATAGATGLPVALRQSMTRLLLCEDARLGLGLGAATSDAEVRAAIETRLERLHTLVNSGRVPFGARRDAALVEGALMRRWSAPEEPQG